MPATPYKAKILEGAQAYSAPFGTPWGNATYTGVVTVGSEMYGYGRIDLPVWPKNGKAYWVKLQYLQEYIEPPLPDEEYVLYVLNGVARKFVPE